VTNHLVPKWGKLRAGAVTRGHVKSVMRNLESTPTLANQVKAAASAIFTWAITEEVGGVKENPCKLIKTNDTTSRERILSDSEVSAFWKSFDRAGPVRAAALRVLLLCGQRPGEIGKMRAEHVKDNWWGLPGAPVPALGWDGTKNKQNHRVWLSTAVVAIIKELHGGNLPATGFVFRNARGDGPIADIGGAMRDINKHLGIIDDPAKPHDLRRSFCSMVTKLKFGRDAMDRLSNHKESGVTDVYDRTNYSEEDMRIWETVAAKFLELVEGKSESNVVNLRG
jgi:integrase